MQKNDFYKALRASKQDIEPKADWKQSNRDLLVSQLSAQTRIAAGSERGNIFIPLVRSLQFAAKPIAAVFIIVLVGLGSYTASVSATKNSLPGDLFYPVKLTSERVQVNFAKNKEEKAKLEIAFASRRLQEVQEVKKDPTKKAEDLSVPIQKFKENVIQAKGHLEQVKQEDAAVALVLADSLDDQTEEFITVLESEKKEKNEVKNEKLNKEINDAILVTKDTNTAAVTLIIKTKKSTEETDDETSQDEIEKKVEDRLTKMTAKAKEVTDKLAEFESAQVAGVEPDDTAAEEGEVVEEELADEAVAEEASVEPADESKSDETPTTEDLVDRVKATLSGVESLLAEAQELLEVGDVEAAFEKITEADRSLFDAENIIEDLLETAVPDVAEEDVDKSDEESEAGEDGAAEEEEEVEVEVDSEEEGA